MITNAQIKFIKSLAQAKNREQHNLYIAEGEKLAIEWLQSSANVQMIIATSLWISKNQLIISKVLSDDKSFLGMLELKVF